MAEYKIDIEKSAQNILDRVQQKLGISAEQLMDLVQAYQDGRCVVLPCKPGDKVYQQNGVAVYELEIQKLIFDCGYIAFDESAIGKTVFLTEPAAQAALEGEYHAEVD